MDELYQFIQEYIKAEHEIYITGITERDTKKYLFKEASFKEKYYDKYDIINSNLARDSDENEDYFEDAKEMANNSIPRILFQIKKYQHPKYDELFRCYLSRTSPHKIMKKNYRENFFVIKNEKKIEIISVYVENCKSEKMKTDLQDWRYRYGEEITELGSLLEVKKIQPPEGDICLAEYNAE